MAQNTHIRERLHEIMSKSEEEKKWWESRRAMIQSDFMKELDEEKAKGSEDEAVLVQAGGPTGSVGKKAQAV
jgi:translocation protein SEC66